MKIDVELKNVIKKFGDVVAVDGVSLWVGNTCARPIQKNAWERVVT